MYAGRVLWYFIHLSIYNSLGLLRFFGKPGSRLIVPVVLVAFALLLRTGWHEVITYQLRAADPGYQPETGVLDVVLVVVVALLIVAYILMSKILGFVLGAFPLAMRPLWPQRDLKAKKQEITSAVVRVVVPPLRRQ